MNVRDLFSRTLEQKKNRSLRYLSSNDENESALTRVSPLLLSLALPLASGEYFDSDLGSSQKHNDSTSAPSRRLCRSCALRVSSCSSNTWCGLLFFYFLFFFWVRLWKEISSDRFKCDQPSSVSLEERKVGSAGQPSL